MNRKETPIELIYHAFGKDELERIQRSDLENLWKTLGLSDYWYKFPEKEKSFSYDTITNIMQDINNLVEDEKNDGWKNWFDSYSDEKGRIHRDNLRAMLINHCNSLTKEEIEVLWDEYFRDQNHIGYEEFKRIYLF